MKSLWPLIEPTLAVKIRFTGLDRKLVVLPGDQIKIRMVTSLTDQMGIRLKPDVASPDMPEPLKSRY